MSQINEIYKLDNRLYPGRKNDIGVAVRDDSAKQYPNSDLYYSVEQNPAGGYAVFMFDNNDVIACLSLEPTRYCGQRLFSTDTIIVLPEYRGRGIARALYWIAIEKFSILLSGQTQTAGGRLNWLNLSQMPGVEVQGIAAARYDFSDMTMRNLKKHGCKIMVRESLAFFPVVAKGRELASAIPGIRLYGPSDYEVRLLATRQGYPLPWQ